MFHSSLKSFTDLISDEVVAEDDDVALFCILWEVSPPVQWATTAGKTAPEIARTGEILR